MNVKFDRELVQQTYDALSNYVKELEEKKMAALAMSTPVGSLMAERLDDRIKEKKKELENIKYALVNMT